VNIYRRSAITMMTEDHSTRAVARLDLAAAEQTMVDTMTGSKTEITLKGSVEIVSDFFFTAINSILYQR
jgi:hypothetical protein